VGRGDAKAHSPSGGAKRLPFRERKNFPKRKAFTSPPPGGIRVVNEEAFSRSSDKKRPNTYLGQGKRKREINGGGSSPSGGRKPELTVPLALPFLTLGRREKESLHQKEKGRKRGELSTVSEI